jgi:predicted  nucleic acid-binding Zn-ribbon protein
MFCPNCGNHILDANASFCPNCGAQLNSFTQGNDQSSAQQDSQQDSQQNSQQDSQQDFQQDSQQDSQQDFQQNSQQNSQQDFQQDSQQNSQQNFQQDSQQNSQQDSQQSWYNQFNYTPPQQDCTPCAPSANYNGLSIAGFSLSCAAIIFNFLFGLPGIVGLILSIVGLCQCNKRSEKGRGLAIAGIVIGAVLTLLMIFVYAGLILAFDNPWNSGPRYY